MRHLYIFAFFLTLFAFHSVWAQQAKPDYSKEFAALVSQSETMPVHFNFLKTRELYTKLPDFHPYLTDVDNDFRPFMKRLEARDETVLPEIEAYTKKNFPLMAAHARALDAYKIFGDKAEKMAYHEWAAKGISKAMSDSGDALTMETALPIVNMGEENLIVKRRGQVVRQETINDPQTGRMYDKFIVIDAVTGQTARLWFDITIVYAHRAQDYDLYQKAQGAK